MALNDAMDSCRPSWSDKFRSWLIDMVISGFESAVVNFRGEWFGVEEGVPTGGITSVSVANISVYYVFKMLIYSQENKLLDFLRFVDDGLGFLSGDEETFKIWMRGLNESSTDI